VSALHCGASVRALQWSKCPRTTVGKRPSSTVGQMSELYCGASFSALMFGKCPPSTLGKFQCYTLGHVSALYFVASFHALLKGKSPRSTVGQESSIYNGSRVHALLWASVRDRLCFK
jgi:hypothetical protein